MATNSVTDSSFEKDVLGSKGPVLVDFWAEWCGPCRALSPVLEEVASELGDKVKVVKINVDENPEAPAKYGVRGIPTLILFSEGQLLDRIVGSKPKDSILQFLKTHI